MVFVLGCFLSFSAKASHCAGGEIVYKHLPNTPDSVYHIIFKLYRDCSGSNAPVSVPLCVRNACNTSTMSITLTKPANIPGGPNGQPVETGCSQYPTSCQQTGSLLPGYQEWWYEGDVTLPGRCAKWEFSVAIGARNASTNLAGNASNVFYIKASLNNLAAQGNSSPEFTVKPVPYVCINVPYTYNNGVQDADGDSLTYSIINPLKSGSISGCGDTGATLSYTTAIPAFNTATNPIACNNSFTMNQFGQMSFMPVQTGKYTLTLLVKEYRQHQLIGSAMRDIQVQVLNCNNVQPVVTLDTSNVTGGQWVNGRFENCANEPLHFCFSFNGPNPNLIYIAKDNHLFSAPSATVVYTGQFTNNIQGCFTWFPGNMDTGLHVFTVTIKDSTCLAPGIAPSNTFSYPIYVAPVAHIDRDTNICLGDSVRLFASGGSAFTWTALPGGSGIGSLSCTHCDNPFAHPTVTTRYVVTSNVVSYCNRNKDTVTVTVSTFPVSPQPTVNSPVCKGQTLSFSAGVVATSYHWTGPAGFNATSANPIIANAQLPNSGTYQVITRNGACYSAPATVQATVSDVPAIPQVSGTSVICEGAAIELTAAGSAGAVYKWNGPAGYNHTGITAGIPSATVLNAGLYTVVAYNPDNAACFSTSAPYNVQILPHLTASFTLSADSICQNQSVQVTYIGTGTYSSLNWGFGKGIVLSGTDNGPFTVRYDSAGVETIHVVSANAGCSDSTAKQLVVKKVPPSGFRLQKDACIGDLIQLNANRNISKDLIFHWQFADATVFEGEGKGSYALYYLQPGYKIITLQTESESCSSFVFADTLFVHPHPVAKITYLSKNDICTGDTVTLRAADTAGYHYNWTPEIAFYENNMSFVNARVGQSGFLKLRVSDDYGCAGRDSIAINTHPCCEVVLPNAFTPNGDGRNDLFRIITIGHHNISGFRIFDRWGQMIFETADEVQGWDGTRGGIAAEAGTYFYYLRYRCSNNQYYEQKGELTLIR